MVVVVGSFKDTHRVDGITVNVGIFGVSFRHSTHITITFIGESVAWKHEGCKDNSRLCTRRIHVVNLSVFPTQVFTNTEELGNLPHRIQSRSNLSVIGINECTVSIIDFQRQPVGKLFISTRDCYVMTIESSRSENLFYPVGICLSIHRILADDVPTCRKRASCLLIRVCTDTHFIFPTERLRQILGRGKTEHTIIFNRRFPRSSLLGRNENDTCRTGIGPINGGRSSIFQYCN